MTEEMLLHLLQTAFPNGVIYSDEYYLKDMKGTDLAGRNRGFGYHVRRLSKAAGLLREEWLAQHGFVWKETGYVEPDMKIREVERRETGAFSTADYILRTYPLAGEYIPTPTEAEELYQFASETVRKLFNEDGTVQAQDYVVLTVETIQLLKDWSNSGGDNTFWSYVFQQYGFDTEGRSDAEQRLYGHFRKAVQYTLTHYNRFFAPSNKQRYYTSLLLHALAPRQSIEALFNVLFDFYARTLDFQYVTEDISYKVFTRGMQARWNGKIAVDETIQLRSDVVSSGLQTLFEQRPSYMADLCDRIVNKMDALLRGEGRITLHEDKNYWDRILLEWYKKKSRIDRQTLQGERRSRRMDYVASSRDKIYVRYAMQNSTVGLEVPRIRLPDVRRELPLMIVYQDTEEVLRRELSVTGSDLCLTTRSCFLPLKEMNLDLKAPLKLRAEILYGSEALYDSGSRLNRAYLFLDSDGRERRVKTGTAWLFAGSGQQITFAGESGVYLEPHPGQLFRLNLSEVTSAAVDGTEVFADDRTASKFRCHTTVRKVGRVYADDLGRVCEIMPDEFSLTICLPEGERHLRYQILTDGQPAETCVDEEKFRLRPPCKAGKPHCVQVVDLVSGQIRFEYRYLVLPEFCMGFHAGLYRENSDTALVRFSWRGYTGEFSVPVPEEGDTVQISVPGIQTPFEVELPVIHCTFLGRSAFSAPEAVWHKDIPAGEFVTVQTPEDWTGSLMLGTRTVPADRTGRRFELGNAIRSGNERGRTEQLWLSLKNSRGVVEKFKLTDIVFASGFLNAPLEVLENRLCWRFAENFCGEKDPAFLIVCTGEDEEELTFSTGTEDVVLAESGALTGGRYSYQVYLKTRSVFGAKKGELLFSGSFRMGDPMEYMLAGKELHLRSALCWDYSANGLKNKTVQPGNGILFDFVYQDTTAPSGEKLRSPMFEATMLYTDRDGVRRPFSFRNSDGFEAINPVRVWIVNEHLLVLHCATDDGVQLDNQDSTLINRDPTCYLSKEEQFERLETPDYFQYEIREEQDV